MAKGVFMDEDRALDLLEKYYIAPSPDGVQDFSIYLNTLKLVLQTATGAAATLFGSPYMLFILPLIQAAMDQLPIDFKNKYLIERNILFHKSILELNGRVVEIENFNYNIFKEVIDKVNEKVFIWMEENKEKAYFFTNSLVKIVYESNPESKSFLVDIVAKLLSNRALSFDKEYVLIEALENLKSIDIEILNALLPILSNPDYSFFSRTESKNQRLSTDGIKIADLLDLEDISLPKFNTNDILFPISRLQLQGFLLIRSREMDVERNYRISPADYIEPAPLLLDLSKL